MAPTADSGEPNADNREPTLRTKMNGAIAFVSPEPSFIVRPLFVLFLVSSLAVRVVAAQGRPAQADSARPIEGVKVTAPRATTVTGGASAMVLDPLQITTIPPAPSLEQLLRRTPFVLVRQNSRGESELSVRGSDSRQAAVLLDGLPLTIGWDHRSDPSLVPLTAARRVTLVRGLSTLLAGPNVLGGVIEVDVAGGTTRDVPDTHGARGGIALGEHGARVLTASTTGAWTLSSRVLSVRAGGTDRHREGVRLARAETGAPLQGEGRDSMALLAGGPRTNSDLSQRDAFVALRVQGASGAYLGATLAGYRARRGVPPELHIAAPRLWRYPVLDRALGVVSAGSGPVTTPLGHGVLAASLGVNAAATEIEGFGDRAYTRITNTERGDEQTTSARAHGTHWFGATALRASLTHARVRYRERVDADPEARYRQQLTSAATELELPPFSGVRAIAGIAHDRATTPETGGRPALGSLARWGWRAGLSRNVGSDALTVHASASRRARFPALRELYSGALARFEPNPTLRPETLTGIEGGVTMGGENGLQGQAVLFGHRLEDAVVRITLPNGRLMRVNRDRLRSTGIELLAAYSGAVRAGGDRWRLSADVMAQRVRVIDASVTSASERFPEHVPKLRGSMEASIPLVAQLRAVAGARYSGSQWCVHPDLGRQVELRKSTVADAALSREWRLAGRAKALIRQLRAVIAADNLFDAMAYDQCGLPQPGRTIRVGVEVY